MTEQKILMDMGATSSHHKGKKKKIKNQKPSRNNFGSEFNK